MSSGRDEMMSNWDEEQRMKDLERVSFNMDDFFAAQANLFNLSIGALNGIILARLMRLNMEIGNEEDFIKTLRYIVEENETIKGERSLQ